MQMFYDVHKSSDSLTRYCPPNSHSVRMQWFFLNHTKFLGNPYPVGILRSHITKHLESGFIRRTRDAEHCRRIAQEVLKLLTVSNQFLIVCFQQLVVYGRIFAFLVALRDVEEVTSFMVNFFAISFW